MPTIRALAFLASLAAAAAMARPASAQSTFAELCAQPDLVASGAGPICLASAQAAASAQPTIGLLFAGGAPTTGYGAGGLRLGIAPRASAGARVNLVPVSLPDIVSPRSSDDPDTPAGTFESVLASLILDASITITNGADLSPSYGGIGALSVILSTSFVPFTAADGDIDQSDFAYGIGGRVQILRESFVAPAMSVSLMRRRLGSVTYGNVCPVGTTPVDNPDPGMPQIEACLRGGDPGQAALDLTNWSGRATVSKNYYGLAGLVGLGYDRFASDVDFAVRAPNADFGGVIRIFRFDDVDLESSRWTAFANLSFNFLVGSITAEAGWQTGTSAINGFSDVDSSFDPDGGSWFGGVGARISL